MQLLSLSLSLSLSLYIYIYIYIQTHTTTVFQFSFIDIYECTKKCCIHDTTMLQVHGYLPILVFEKEKKKSTYSCKMLHTTMLQVHDNLPILVLEKEKKKSTYSCIFASWCRFQTGNFLFIISLFFTKHVPEDFDKLKVDRRLPQADHACH